MWRRSKKPVKGEELLSKKDAQILLSKFKYRTLTDLVFQNDESNESTKKLKNEKIVLSNVIVDENGMIQIWQNNIGEEEWEDDEEYETRLEQEIYDQMYEDIEEDVQEQYEKQRFNPIPQCQDDEWVTDEDQS